MIYPKGLSKRFTSQNMMQFWTNFAKSDEAGVSTNGIEWKKYNGQENSLSNYMILDKRKDLRMHKDNFSFYSLTKDLYNENALTNLEKCVVLFQMLTYVGDDIYDEYVDYYPGSCDLEESKQFLIKNASFIDY